MENESDPSPNKKPTVEEPASTEAGSGSSVGALTDADLEASATPEFTLQSTATSDFGLISAPPTNLSTNAGTTDGLRDDDGRGDFSFISDTSTVTGLEDSTTLTRLTPTSHLPLDARHNHSSDSTAATATGFDSNLSKFSSNADSKSQSDIQSSSFATTRTLSVTMEEFPIEHATSMTSNSDRTSLSSILRGSTEGNPGSTTSFEVHLTSSDALQSTHTTPTAEQLTDLQPSVSPSSKPEQNLTTESPTHPETTLTQSEETTSHSQAVPSTSKPGDHVTTEVHTTAVPVRHTSVSSLGHDETTHQEHVLSSTRKISDTTTAQAVPTSVTSDTTAPQLDRTSEGHPSVSSERTESSSWPRFTTSSLERPDTTVDESRSTEHSTKISKTTAHIEHATTDRTSFSEPLHDPQVTDAASQASPVVGIVVGAAFVCFLAVIIVIAIVLYRKSRRKSCEIADQDLSDYKSLVKAPQRNVETPFTSSPALGRHHPFFTSESTPENGTRTKSPKVDNHNRYMGFFDTNPDHSIDDSAMIRPADSSEDVGFGGKAGKWGGPMEIPKDDFAPSSPGYSESYSVNTFRPANPKPSKSNDVGKQTNQDEQTAKEENKETNKDTIDVEKQTNQDEHTTDGENKETNIDMINE